jgi:hypothetical protein
MLRVYPIGFSIHSSKITDEIPEKKRLLAPLIPGNTSTYIYHTEKDYYDAYKESYFAITHRKAGWDCMRHYEILACGCIPLFPDLEHCPSKTMTHFPKEIVRQTNQIYHNILSKSDNPMAVADQMNLKELYIKPLLQLTKTQMTNVALAKYILEKSDHINTTVFQNVSHNMNREVKRILYLSGDTDPDYLRCVTLPGFKELFGTECHDYPKIKHIYTDYPEDQAKQLYGRGLTYTRLVDPSMRNEAYDATVEDDIKHHRYDLIIYGSYHRGMPLWDQVNAAYEKKDVVLMCGEDLHHCNYHQYAQQGYVVFVREL